MDRNGSLHVLDLGTDPNSGHERYAITFTPYDKKGGALPAREALGDTALMQFLTEIKISTENSNRLLSELRKSRRATVGNVVLTDEQLKTYGLAEMGVFQSIISYLST